MEEKTTPKIKILKQDVYKVKKQFVKGRNDISKLMNISDDMVHAKAIKVYQANLQTVASLQKTAYF